MTKKEWTIIGVLGAVVVIVFCLGGILIFAALTPSQTQVVAVEATATPAQPKPTVMPSATLRPNPTNALVIQQSARTDVTYDSLARNTESYVGQLVYYRGRVEQVAEVSGLKVVLRVSVTQGDYGLWSDIVWVNYEGPRVLQNDIVHLTGKVKGRHEYTSVLGQSIVIPEIDAVSLEVETPETASATNTRPATPIPTPAKVGQRIEAGGTALTVASVSRTNQISDYSKPKAGNVYLVAEVIIENVSGDGDYNPLYFTVKDSNGVEYQAGFTAPDPALHSGKLAKGDKVRGKVAFEVNAAAKGFILAYNPNVFGEPPFRVNLGQ